MGYEVKKMYRAREDFLWYKRGQDIPEKEMQDNWKQHCEDLSEVLKPVLEVEHLSPLDLNKDGVVNKKDYTMAAEVLNSIERKVGRPKKS